MVLSGQFAALSEKKFSFYDVDINGIDQLVSEEKEEIQKLMEENEIVESPSLLFLNPESMETKHLYCGAQDLEATLIIGQIAAELE